MRKSYFKDITLYDIIKMSYFEFIINEYLTYFNSVFNIDVMSMTTADWIRALLSPLVIFIVLPLYESYRYCLMKKMSYGELDSLSYSYYVVYRRDCYDFECQPHRIDNDKQN